MKFRNVGRIRVWWAAVFAVLILSALAAADSPVAAQDCAATPWRCAPSRPSPDPSRDVPRGVLYGARMSFLDAGADVSGRLRIFAVGRIDDGTSREFTAFLNARRVPAGALVILHSPGGDVSEGLMLGRMIRARSLRTTVGQWSPAAASGLSLLGPGVCASSCSLAFLGGVERTVPDGSFYGVHAAFIEGNPVVPGLMDLGQDVAALVSTYAHDMGIEANFLADMTSKKGSAGEIEYLSRGRMAELGVTTEFATTWAVRTSPDGFLLVGSNPESSVLPGNREEIVLQCTGTPRRLVLGAYYMPEDSHLLASSSPVGPAAFAALVSGLTLGSFNPRASRPEDLSQSIDIPAADVTQPARAAGPHRVSAFIAATAPVVSLLRRAEILTFTFKRALGFPVGVSVDMGAGRSHAMDFIASCR